MPDFIKEFIKDQNILSAVFNLIRISLSALGVVYLFGRMLNILKKYKQKNLVGFIMMLINSIGIVYLEKMNVSKTFEIIFLSYLYCTIAIVLYVWVLWRSFDRVDNFLDRRRLKDKGFKGK